MENQNKPKKNSIDLPNRKVDIEIVDVSDDEVKSTTPPGAPGHHGAHGHRENKTKSVSKDVKQGTHKPKATTSREPQANTQKPTATKPPRGKPPVNPESPEKVVLPKAKERERNIICLGPRTEENAKAYDITKKNLK